MVKLIGETVIVNGEPVDNVLVEPGEHADAEEASRPAGVIVAYVLRFPSTYEGPLCDASVVVRGVECRSVGYCDHIRPRDVFGSSWGLPWDMTVPVRLCAGEMTCEIAIFANSTTYDECGRPVRMRSLVWSGLAQARRAGAANDGEEKMPDGSKRAAETWVFVVPWLEQFTAMRPESTVVEMEGVDYDVVSIENINSRSEFASVKAVRHG